MAIDRRGLGDASNVDFRRLLAAPRSRRRLVREAAVLGAGAVSLGITRPTTAGADDDSDLKQSQLRETSSDARTLRIAAFASPPHLDPHLAYEYQSTLAILGAYEGLICLKDGTTDEYEGLIAERWSANADKSVWTFHLRDRVTFHDGTPVDAEAVRYSFERFLTLNTPSSGIVKRFFTDPRQIVTPDAKTVVFELGKPQPLFEAAMASTYGPEIVNARRLKTREVNGDWGLAWADLHEDGCGSGPYRIVDFQPDQMVELERYPNYWRGWEPDHFDRIVIRVVPDDGVRRLLIESGDADIVDNLTPGAIDALKRNPDVVVDEQISTQVQYFAFAITGPLATPETRIALCCAFPYAEVVAGAYGGYAERAIGPVARATRGFAANTEHYDTDLAGASKLLAKAGVPSGMHLRMAIPTGDAEIDSTAQLFQSNLVKLGFDVTIESSNLLAHSELLYGETPVEDRPHLMWWGWWPDYNDAWNHLYPQVACAAWSPNGGNAGFYCNADVDALLERARNATTDHEYNDALAAVQQIASYDDPPAIYYLQPKWVTVLRNDVTGFVFNPINIGTYNFWKLRRKL